MKRLKRCELDHDCASDEIDLMRALSIEPVIEQKGYDTYINGKKPRYLDFKFDKQELIVCKCGSKTFWIHQPSGLYETNAICTECSRFYCVHDG